MGAGAWAIAKRNGLMLFQLLMERIKKMFKTRMVATQSLEVVAQWDLQINTFVKLERQ